MPVAGTTVRVPQVRDRARGGERRGTASPDVGGVPAGWPECQFEEAVHAAVFSGGALDGARVPLLRWMWDDYADARCVGADLRGLVAELEGVLPRFAANLPAHRVLRRLLEVCRDAAAQSKVALCPRD